MANSDFGSRIQRRVVAPILVAHVLVAASTWSFTRPWHSRHPADDDLRRSMWSRRVISGIASGPVPSSRSMDGRGYTRSLGGRQSAQPWAEFPRHGDSPPLAALALALRRRARRRAPGLGPLSRPLRWMGCVKDASKISVFLDPANPRELKAPTARGNEWAMAPEAHKFWKPLPEATGPVALPNIGESLLWAVVGNRGRTKARDPVTGESFVWRDLLLSHAKKVLTRFCRSSSEATNHLGGARVWSSGVRSGAPRSRGLKIVGARGTTRTLDKACEDCASDHRAFADPIAGVPRGDLRRRSDSVAVGCPSGSKSLVSRCR